MVLTLVGAAALVGVLLGAMSRLPVVAVAGVAILQAAYQLLAPGNHSGLVHSGKWVGQLLMLEPGLLLGPSYHLVGAMYPLGHLLVPAVVGDHRPSPDAAWVILAAAK